MKSLLFVFIAVFFFSFLQGCSDDSSSTDDDSTDDGTENTTVDSDSDEDQDTASETEQETDTNSTVETDEDTESDTASELPSDSQSDSETVSDSASEFESDSDSESESLSEGDPEEDLSFSIIYPAAILNTNEAEYQFPTYLAHLVGSNDFDCPGGVDSKFNFAELDIENNSTTTSYAITATSSLEGYSSVDTTFIDVDPVQWTVSAFNPIPDLSDLYGFSTAIPSTMSTTASTAGFGNIFNEDLDVTILPVNEILLWDAPCGYDGLNARDLAATLVTPHDSANAVENMISESVEYTPWSYIYGYDSQNYFSNDYVLEDGYYYTEMTYMNLGEVVDISSLEITGGIDPMEIYVFDNENYGLFSGGLSSVTEYANLSASTGDDFDFEAPASGWYYFVFLNPSSNIINKSVSYYMGLSDTDVTLRIAKAFFYKLRDDGFQYTSVSSSLHEGTQHVRLPSESLSQSSGNCIDGAVLFASAFEAVGMKPHLIFQSGHAYVGIEASKTDPLVWPIETTMVGGTSTFWEALNTGIENYNNAIENDFWFHDVDVEEMRNRGITYVND